MGALNAICPDNDFALAEDGEVLCDPVGSAAIRCGTLGVLKRERWSLKHTLRTKAERDVIFAIFAAANGVGSILWTPPGEGSDRRFRFVRESYQESELTAQNFAIQFTLQAVPGIAV